MNQHFRIALANLPYPAGLQDAVLRTQRAVAEAGKRGAHLVAFPEAYIPGYPWPGRKREASTEAALHEAHAVVAAEAARRQVAVILGTERIAAGQRYLTAMAADAKGQVLGFQDKVQLDPSEDADYAPGYARRLFEIGGVRVGVVICHEGFRYPETVRWAAQRGAQLVVHPHFSEAEPDSKGATEFAQPGNSFHEKAVLCRAAENGCFFATINCASPRSPTTSAVARPDGSLLAAQPYGAPGLLVCDLDLSETTPQLPARLRRAALSD